MLSILILITTSKIQTCFARTILFFAVMNVIFQYDVVLISLNDKRLDTFFKHKIKCFYSIINI